MICNEYHWVIEFLKPDGGRLAQLPARINFESAVEDTAWAAQRRAHPAVSRTRSGTTIEPLPDPTAGSPLCRGFRVALGPDAPDRFTRDFDTSYFREAAEAGAASLVEKGVLRKGDKYHYRVAAYPRPLRPAPAEADRPRVTVEATDAPLDLRPGRLADLTAASVPIGDILEVDTPVYITQEVIEQTSQLTERAREKETGGILIGHLHEDPLIPDIGVVITAQVPARYTRASSTELTFTPKTFAAVQATIAARDRGEVYLGWWHSHPSKYWAATTCANCPPERRRVCPVNTQFFSSADRHVHETLFPKSFNVALVVTHTEEGLQQALFGWRHGIIRPRGFFIQRQPDRPLLARAAVATPDASHEPACS